MLNVKLLELTKNNKRYSKVKPQITKIHKNLVKFKQDQQLYKKEVANILKNYKKWIDDFI